MRSFIQYLCEASNSSEKNTLGQVVTELFPCLFFVAGRTIPETSKTMPDDFWEDVKHVITTDESPFLLMGPNNEKTKKYSTLDGLKSIWLGYNSDDNAKSGIRDKIRQAILIYKKILMLQKDVKTKTISAVYWGDQASPDGIQANEADIYIKWSDDTYTGISLKATKTKTGTISLKNRTTNTWFEHLVDNPDEYIEAIRKAVYKVYPGAAGTGIKLLRDGYDKKNKAKQREGVETICNWISQNADMQKIDILRTTEENIKTAFNVAFANLMNDVVKLLGEQFAQKFIDTVTDEIDDDIAYSLLIWKASNDTVEDMTNLSVLDKVRTAKSIIFAQDGLSGIKMILVDNKGQKSTYAINARQSHSLHNKTVDTLLQNVDLSTLNDTFTATIFKDVATLQVMLKLKGN